MSFYLYPYTNKSISVKIQAEIDKYTIIIRPKQKKMIQRKQTLPIHGIINRDIAKTFMNVRISKNTQKIFFRIFFFVLCSGLYLFTELPRNKRKWQCIRPTYCCRKSHFAVYLQVEMTFKIKYLSCSSSVSFKLMSLG